MKILFIHPDFPGPFEHLAPALAADPVHAVVALSARPDGPTLWQGVTVLPYTPADSEAATNPSWLRDFERQTALGEAVASAALQLKTMGFEPEVIVAPADGGEGLFLKDVWPQARLGLHAEVPPAGGPEAGPASADPLAGARLRLQSLCHRLLAEQADAMLACAVGPAVAFPEARQRRITVVPAGIDTEALAPDPEISLTLDGQTQLARDAEVVSFAAPTLAPCHGYDLFLRSLPQLLRQRPEAQVLVIGGREGPEGDTPATGQSWHDRLVAEVRPQIDEADWARVHFVGEVPPATRGALLQLSAVHVHLGAPPSALLEAMSIGCAVVARDSAAVRELIEHDVTGHLVAGDDAPALADTVATLLADAPARARLGAAARALIRQRHDLRTVSLPRQIAWVQALATPTPEAVSPLPPPAVDVPALRESLVALQDLLGH